MNILEISQQAKSVINSFQKLPLGGKEIVCPYYMNLKQQRGGLRVMIGKGTFEEIILETKVWAQLKGFDLNKASEDQIRKFMINTGVGIDCSGFVVYVMNAELESRGLGPIWKYLKYPNNSILAKMRRNLRPVENTGANLMTSDDNCIKIESFDEVLPGDFIRAKGKQKNAHHIAIVTKVVKDENGKVKEIEYANSHRFYEDENGIRIGKITIDKPEMGLKDQKWNDELEGRNYFLEDLLVDYEDNGLRRLKILSK